MADELQMRNVRAELTRAESTMRRFFFEIIVGTHFDPHP